MTNNIAYKIIPKPIVVKVVSLILTLAYGPKGGVLGYMEKQITKRIKQKANTMLWYLNYTWCSKKGYFKYTWKNIGNVILVSTHFTDYVNSNMFPGKSSWRFFWVRLRCIICNSHAIDFFRIFLSKIEMYYLQFTCNRFFEDFLE